MIKTAEPLQMHLVKNCKVEVLGSGWFCTPHKNDTRTTHDRVCAGASPVQ